MRENLSRCAGEDQQGDERQPDIVIGRRVDPEAPAEQLRRGDPVQPHRAVGDARRVAHDDRHDLAEAQGHDRQIVALEAQGRRAEQHAEERGDRRRDRQHQPERHLEMDDIAAGLVKPRDEAEPLERLPEPAPGRRHLPRGEDAVGIGADREKRGVAEIEQPGEADDDVEAERQRGEGQRVRRRVDVGVVAADDREQQRRAIRSPARRHAGTQLRRDPAQPARRARNQAKDCAEHAAGGLGHALGFGRARRAPNSPVGAKTSTSTRIEKMITSVQRTAKTWPPRLSIEADDDAADHRPGDAADAAQHRGGEGPQPGGIADDEAGEVVVEAEDQRRRAGQRRAEKERGDDDPVDIDPHHARRLGILRGRPHRLAEPGAVDEEVQRQPSARARRTRSAPRAVATSRRRSPSAPSASGSGNSSTRRRRSAGSTLNRM